MILPASVTPPKGLVRAGEIIRCETDQLVVGYHFDLRTNTLTSESVPNPGAGREHRFCAWRVEGDPKDEVTLRTVRAKDIVASTDDDAEDS